jgi:hypothetical protein
MRVWVLGAALAAGCDDTVFEPQRAVYPSDWFGVQAFLFEHCYECHPEVEPALDVPSDILNDVCSGDEDYIVPGDPSASMLWRVISGELTDDDPPQMPFGLAPLPAEDIEFLRQWIADGAIIEVCP